MLKRNIAILIAGGLLSAQLNLAAADQVGAVAMSADEQGRGVGSTLPALTDYLEQRAASVQKERTPARGSAFPAYISGTSYRSPALNKYLDERAASIQAEAQGYAYKTVQIEPSTKYVTVEHLGTVKIVNDKGQSFVWTCDAPGEHVVPLKAIAPAGFEAGNVTIYVRHPAAHILG